MFPVLTNYNSYYRRLIYIAAGKAEFGNLVILSSDKSSIRVKKCSEDEKKKREELKAWETIGFTNVIKLLITHRKPIVGHNVFLDLLFLYNTFIDDLPTTYKSFKEDFHSLFDTVYDTKFLSSLDDILKFIPQNSKFYKMCHHSKLNCLF